MKLSKTTTKHLDPKYLYYNQKLWKAVKSLSPGTLRTSASVTLLENNEIISKDTYVAKIFNDYFANITNPLGIEGIGKNIVSTHDVHDPVKIAITEYSLHSSIKKIRENCPSTQKFGFRACSPEEVITQIERMDQKESIQAKVLKENSDLLLTYLSNTHVSSKTTFPMN